jgi:competence protein ComEC
LLIGRDGLTVAVRTSDGSLKLLRPAKDKYSASEWLKRDGDDHSLDAVVATSADGVSCDAVGCVAKAAGGWRVADAIRPDALTEDCANADVVVSAVPARLACKGPKLVVDIYDISRSNGYAVWLGPKLEFESVERERGLRPWSAQSNSRHNQYRRIKPTSLP